MSSHGVKRTYNSRTSKIPLPSSSPSSPPRSLRTGRPLEESTSLANLPPRKRRHGAKLKPSSQLRLKPKQKALTQLHFSLETSVLRTCPLCNLSYTKGAPDDEILHRSHCARVQRGTEWGKEEERDRQRVGGDELESGVKLKDGRKGRIICFKADAGGKIGTKLSILLESINTTLSAPALTSEVLQASKAYLLLLPSSTNPNRENIVGCVIAQRISTAMNVAPPHPSQPLLQPGDRGAPTLPPDSSLVAVDAGTGLFCYPERLPTPLGIPRLFVSVAHRRLGIASHLLSAAASSFIHGCVLDPLKGDVAFTQPTSAGRSVMRSWGKGHVRIYEE